MDGNRKVYEVTTTQLKNMISNQVWKKIKSNRRRKYYSRRIVGQALMYIDTAKVLAVCVIWLTARPVGTYIHHWARRHALEKFHLIQPVYMPTNPNRRQEIEYASKKNAALFKHYTQIVSQHFSDIFKAFKPHKINIIANADIFFDETIKKGLSLTQNHVYALSRHDVSNGKLFKRPDSQDTWIFHGRIQSNMLLMSALYKNNLTLGKPGIDNRLAYELLKAGYHVSNPSKSIRSWHVHGTNIREYSHLDVVPPPYAIVYPMTVEEVLAENNLVKKKTEIFPHGFSLEQVRKMSAYNLDEDN